MKFQFSKAAADMIDELPPSAAENLARTFEMVRDAREVGDLKNVRALGTPGEEGQTLYELRNGDARAIVSLSKDERGEPKLTVLSIGANELRKLRGPSLGI